MVALHGCLQDQSLVGQQFVTSSGLNEWADTNDILVLYPQTISDFSNPESCWDWWGYTGASYALQSAPQMQAIVAMIDQLESPGTTGGGTTGCGSEGRSAGCGCGASAAPQPELFLLAALWIVRRRRRVV